MSLLVQIGALLALATLSQAHAPDSEPDASSQLAPHETGGVTTLELSEGEYGQFTIDVTLGRPIAVGEGEAIEVLPFLLDTGANFTALPYQVAAQLTERERLAPELTGHALTSPFPTNRFMIEALDFGLGARPVEAAVLPEGIDEVLGAAGVLGLNAIRRYPVTIDFPDSELRIGETGAVERHLSVDPEFRLIRGVAQVHGMRRPVHVLIDTGANASVINPVLARMARGDTARGRLRVYGVSGGRPERARSRRQLRGLQMGDLCMGAFWISVVDLYAFEAQGWADEPAMIVGLDILRHGRLSLDPHSQAVSIEGVTAFQCDDRRA